MMTKEIVEQRSLQVTDRCDSCSAQAFVLVQLVNGELQFCGHHYVENEKALKKAAYAIIDEREFIDFKAEIDS